MRLSRLKGSQVQHILHAYPASVVLDGSPSNGDALATPEKARTAAHDRLPLGSRQEHSRQWRSTSLIP